MVDRVSDDNIHFGTVQGITLSIALIKKIAPSKSAKSEHSEHVRQKVDICSTHTCQNGRIRTKVEQRVGSVEHIDVKFWGLVISMELMINNLVSFTEILFVHNVNFVS